MRKLIYITYDSWWDTDISILHQLNQTFKLTVFVINGYGELKFKNKKIPGINIAEFNTIHSTWSIKRVLRSITMFCEMVKNYSKDDVIFYTIGSDIILKFCFLIFIRKKKTIISVHNFKDHVDSRIGLNNLIKKIFYRRYCYFHFFSNFQKSLFEKKYPQKKSFYSNMPLKDYGIAPSKKTNKIVFLFFGFIRDYKRLDLFISAANKINNSNALFYIVGACKNWSKYEHLISDHNKYRCCIKFIDNNDIPIIFANASFLVLPYDDTTQSGPLLIAINYGIPIIASDLPGFKQIVNNNINGFLFKTGSIDSLEEAFIKSLNLSKIDYQKMREEQIHLRDKMNSSSTLAKELKSFVQKYIK